MWMFLNLLWKWLPLSVPQLKQIIQSPYVSLCSFGSVIHLILETCAFIFIATLTGSFFINHIISKAKKTFVQGCIDRTLIGYSLTHTLGYQVVNPEKAAQGIVCFFICCLRVLFWSKSIWLHEYWKPLENSIFDWFFHHSNKETLRTLIVIVLFFSGNFDGKGVFTCLFQAAIGLARRRASPINVRLFYSLEMLKGAGLVSKRFNH